MKKLDLYEDKTVEEQKGQPDPYPQSYTYIDIYMHTQVYIHMQKMYLFEDTPVEEQKGPPDPHPRLQSLSACVYVHACVCVCTYIWTYITYMYIHV